jgi:KDO2-lipid IV(A) lauroyltransferase
LRASELPQPTCPLTVCGRVTVQDPSSGSNPVEAELERRSARTTLYRGRSQPWRAWLGVSALRAGSKLSYPMLYRLGGLAGAALHRFPTDERAASRVNLRVCLPELAEAQREQLVRESLIETGRTFAEFGALWCWPAQRVLELIVEVRGLELFDAARAAGRGILIIAPHLGAWEAAGLFLSARAPMTSMYKRPPVVELEEFYCRARGRLGAKLAPNDAGGVAMLLRALRNREVAGILPDQDPGRGAGVFAPWFGVAANTSTLASKLAAKSGACVLFAWCERLPQARGYRVHLSAPRREIADADPLAGTVALNLELEELIRAAPQHYLWSYKRLRNRPEGLGNPYRQGVSEQTIGRRSK